MRIGFGYDVHRLESGYELVLGGVKIPFEKGPVAHSDGDVLIHAICDAILGAASMGDIGTQFPDTDPDYRNIASTILLRKTMGFIRKEGYGIINVDATICLQKPRLAPYIEKMKGILSELLDTSAVSIKATTTERLGFVGREEGIAAYAVVLIE